MEEKNKILIVDDDSFLLDMYALKFDQSGFKVETASNAKDALEKVKNGLQVNVLLLDIVMPNMDGFELLEHLHSDGYLADSYKIFLSNKGQEEDIERGKELGADGYIIKANNTPSEVIEKVGEIINQKTQD